jgi:predicted RND superfamily exporter protein
MKPVADSLSNLYLHVILDWPKTTLFSVLLAVVVVGAHVPQFRLDASADALVLENDDALRYYRIIRERYGSDDYLIVTYSPNDSLFSDAVLRDLAALRDALASLDRVSSVTSILDVPLIQSPPVTIGDLREGAPTLEGPTSDPALARRELLSSPLYSDLLISADERTTALLVQFARDETYERLQSERDALREERRTSKLSQTAGARLSTVSAEFERYKAEAQSRTGREITAVREILDRHRDHAVLHLGGVPMIVADSIDFIRSDLVKFGAGVLAFLVLILSIAFRAPRWVVLPLLTCAAVGVLMIGFLGWTGWAVTVVSSNFISVLLIITLSLTIHLIVSYQELQSRTPNADQRTLVRSMIEEKAQPCAYTAVTTAVAFGSLLVSGIRPVIDFGWMMVVGIAIAFVLAFVFFPAAMMLLEPPKSKPIGRLTARITASLALLVRRRESTVLGAFAAVTLICVGGISLLSVENRFIDYFKSSTEIHRGMVLVDRELGGTTPLDVIVDAPVGFFEQQRAALEDPVEDPDFEEWGSSGGIAAASYWFKSRRMGEIEQIHDFLDQRPEIGKVLSLQTSMEMLETIEAGLTQDDIALSILYKKLPESIKASLIDPYFSEEAHQVRFALRVFESDPSLDRQALLETIRTHLTDELGHADDRVHLTGMVVLYNNMLQSLFRTQILTVGVVFGMIWLMFIFAFRNALLAAIAVVPNLFAGASILGLMGLLGIPLDLMTITIAAISIGIGVDDTIHYVHRMMTEMAAGDRRHNGHDEVADYWSAVERSHASVGRAMYYTTLAIALGFSILALSNFVPTVYFGLLTGLAMIAALVADLTLLPLLIVRFRPFERSPEAQALEAE